MSQCSRDTSSPNAAIDCAPTDPTIRSNCGAIASNARAIRSSFKAAASIPNTSSTAQDPAQSVTRNSGAGEVNRLATRASMT
jgi:hypothetical protein